VTHSVSILAPRRSASNTATRPLAVASQGAERLDQRSATDVTDKVILSDTNKSKPKPSLLQKVVREAAFIARKVGLNLASPIATLFGVGLGVSPARLTGADQLHKRGIDGSGVRVAILDQAFTTFGAGSEDVLGVYEARNGTFQEGLKKSTSDPVREVVTKEKGISFHGNAMSCIVTGESMGLTGVAPGAEVIGVSVLDEGRRLTPELFIKGLQWVADHHQEQNIKAISASVNYRSPTPEHREATQALVNQLKSEGVTLVVAAGNRGPGDGTIMFPADLDNVVSVGATTQGVSSSVWDDRVERYSSRGGAGKPSPKLLAPGGDIFTKDAHGTVELTKGTSNSAPMVAGAIALLSQAFPGASSENKVNALYSTAEPVTGDVNAEGYGAMRLQQAYENLKGISSQTSSESQECLSRSVD
jgi:Subtilase family